MALSGCHKDTNPCAKDPTGPTCNTILGYVIQLVTPLPQTVPSDSVVQVTVKGRPDIIRALTARYRDLEARHTITRRVTDNARIATAIISHISRAGSWVRPGVLATTWSRLWAALGEECAIDEEAALSIVERTTELAIDRDADQITLELLAMA